MNKTELIEAIAASADIPKAAAGRALDAVVENITSALKSGDSVVLVGFGTFLCERACGTYWPQPADWQRNPNCCFKSTRL